MVASQYLLSFLTLFGINRVNLIWTFTTVTKKLHCIHSCACDKKREISCDVICGPTGHNPFSELCFSSFVLAVSFSFFFLN